MKPQTYECYVEFLDSTNNFKKTSKDFIDFDEAMTWMRDNFEKIDPDMVKYYDKPKSIKVSKGMSM
ncbi:MAG: hypothetical protein ABJF65_00195 [Reichenbachiella sp.]|uniref:hypothetical protein n=1 Tax=Reichenbachiella sp. TaxID=2184521 RepID=UPI0032676C33